MIYPNHKNILLHIHEDEGERVSAGGTITPGQTHLGRGDIISVGPGVPKDDYLTGNSQMLEVVVFRRGDATMISGGHGVINYKDILATEIFPRKGAE